MKDIPVHVHVMAENTRSEVIQIATVGRPFKLGMLYDCRTEKLVPGITLWDKSTLEENIISEPQTSVAFEIITNDNMENKSHALDINPNLRLSFLCDLIEVSGSAQYLKGRTSSSYQESVTLDYSCKTKYESLTMAQLAKGNFQHPEVFSSDMATHVVTGIRYGAHVFLLFRKAHSESESNRTKQLSVKALVDKIPKINTGGGIESHLSDEESKQADTIHVKFYGDFIPPVNLNPSTYQEAVDLYKTLPELLGESDKNTVPLIAYLLPLSELHSKASKLVREISDNLVDDITKELEQLHNHEIKSSDLMESPACKNFHGLKTEIGRFKDMIDKYRSEFKKVLLPFLKKVRGGVVEESELNKILKEKHESPFTSEWLSK